jgi:putative transposase
MKAFKFRLYPNQIQTEAMNHHLWLSKELWNQMLDYTKNKYKTEKKVASKKELREMVKHQGLFSQVAQELVDRLIDAIWRYIELKKQGVACGFPRFKSFDRMKSLCYPQMGFKLIGNHIQVSLFGSIKLKLHRPIKGKIKTLTLKREASGKWFAVFCVKEHQIQVAPNSGTKGGVDLGLSKLAVCSDGSVIANPHHFKKYEHRIALLGRRLSRKKKGSRNRFKAKVKLVKAYEKLGNTRMDFLHKTSHSLVHRYSLISLENLNITGMVQESFGKQINDAGWGMLANMLCYKAESAGCKVVFVDPAGTTKECSRCGTVVPKTLWTREHRCPCCGLVLDRDLNAAINILNRTAGHAGNTLVESAQAEQMLKQEAHTYS